VLTLRALAAGVQAPRYWETGDSDNAFRYNNYLSRFHWRHNRSHGRFVRLPGSRPRLPPERGAAARPAWKVGILGDQVWDAWLAGNLVGIRQYCETGRSQHLSHLPAFEMMRGRFNARALRGIGPRAFWNG